jgi:hypothetical protein
LLMLPLGVLIPRCGRALSKGRWWFLLHMATQLLGVMLVIVALATGYKMGAAEGTAHPVSRSPEIRYYTHACIGSSNRAHHWSGTSDPTRISSALVQATTSPTTCGVWTRCLSFPPYRSRPHRSHDWLGDRFDG